MKKSCRVRLRQFRQRTETIGDFALQLQVGGNIRHYDNPQEYRQARARDAAVGQPEDHREPHQQPNGGTATAGQGDGKIKHEQDRPEYPAGPECRSRSALR